MVKPTSHFLPAIMWLAIKFLGKVFSKGDDISESLGKMFLRAKPCGCFTGQTLVLTKEGFSTINAIQVGDSVWSYQDSINVLALT